MYNPDSNKLDKCIMTLVSKNKINSNLRGIAYNSDLMKLDKCIWMINLVKIKLYLNA